MQPLSARRLTEASSPLTPEIQRTTGLRKYREQPELPVAVGAPRGHATWPQSIRCTELADLSTDNRAGRATPKPLRFVRSASDPGGRTLAHHADPCVVAHHLTGRLLDLLHISWRTCVADLLA